MIPNLYTGQPLWLILVCLLLAAGYAIALYFRDRRNEFSALLKSILGILRFVAVFLISFMLLAPFTRSVIRDKAKPVIILALDNSESILLNADSNAYRNAFQDDILELSGKLADQAEVKIYRFGESVENISENSLSNALSFRDQFTDMAGLLTDLGNRYDNRNVGALILATDGIYNTGSNPLYHLKRWASPVYTIALGDTSVRMDQVITKVNYNRLVYLDNQFPLEVVVHAGGAEGRSSGFRVFHNNNMVHSQEFMIDKQDFTRSFPVVLDARQTGIQKYVILLNEIENELSLINNRKEIFVEVLDARNKVLLLAGAPHPDISALKQAVGSNRNYEVEHALANEFNGNLEAYNLVILHQLPSLDYPADALLNSIRDQGVPALYILGARSDLPRFNQRRTGLNLVAGKIVFEETVPVYNPNFTAFSLSEETKTWINGLPPLLSPLGDYQVSNAARILMNQRIGQVETSRPLILLTESLEGRSGVITGEGIWKWRLYNFAKTSHHDYFNELINKLVQYLSLKEQKKNFRVYHPVNFMENEQVIFEAEVYDESYELTNEPEIEVTLQNEEEKQFPYNFSKVANAYRLDAGKFPPGYYTYTAKVNLGDRQFQSSGQFSVSTIDLEALNTVADHHLLSQLALENGGKMFYPGDLDALADEILQRDDIRPVTYTRKKYDDLLNKGWLVALIIGLLSLEWFLRKRAGSY